MGAQTYAVAIVGAGPGGVSAAVRAAEQNLPHVLIEAADQHASTVQQYQRNKQVMAEPCMLPLRSAVAFAAGRREEVLDAWLRAIEASKVNIQYGSEVSAISGSQGDFQLHIRGGKLVRAQNVILALGAQGKPRQLEVPGGDLPCVRYMLASADDHRAEKIIVIGAGDAAIENALSLADHNEVILVNRGTGFPRAKEGNAARILRAIAQGQVRYLQEAQLQRIEPSSLLDAPGPYVATVHTAEGSEQVHCHHIIARLGSVPASQLIEKIGARFTSDAPEATPQLSARYESSIPGLYVIGALAGFPLIKQAMNQGYEVVEHLLGHPVKPADHDILAGKFRPLSGEEDVEETLRRIHSSVHVFRGVTELALREVVLASNILTPRDGALLYTRGTYSSSVFNVLEGHVEISAGDVPTMKLRAGQLFGEMGLISGRPHEFTARAGKNCVVLETPHSAMRKLLRSDPAARAYVDFVYSLRALRLFLMPQASPQTLFALSKSLRLHRFNTGDALFLQGDPTDRFFIVRSGSVALSQKTAQQDAVMQYCAAGSYLDAAGCLAGDTVRSMSAHATVATEVLSIDQAEIRRLLEREPALRDRLQQESAQQLVRQAHMHARPQAGSVFNYLMSHGLGEATSVLVIDEDLCVGCDQCEKACAATHDGVSRLDRSAGPSLYSLHLPTSCRHCEHPHCMQDCPPNAIHRLPNGEVSIADTCIGCGNCVDNCPYGVIRLAEVPSKPSLLQLLRRNSKESEIGKTAVKCDVCADLKSGPACVRACPTGAAIRIHAEDVLTLAKQRAARARERVT
jgi:Fe-S-cluster-containing hydrogenase component 2/thioredoxin reductase/CRP-like cAMP-binding protein